MNDDRSRRGFLAVVALSIAAVTVIAIPVLAPRGMTSGLSSWVGLADRFGPFVAEVLAIAGLIWMLRIWRGGGRDIPPAWRYRDRAEATRLGEPQRDEASDELPIADTRAPGWLLARLELAVAAIVVLLIPILFLGTPTFIGSPRGAGGSSELLGVVANGVALAVTAEALAITGLVWRVRIWRGPLRDQVPAWRYRR